MASSSSHTMTTTWLSLAKAEVVRLQLDPEVYHVLCAFGGPNHAPGRADLMYCEDVDGDDVASRIERILTADGEIDTDQARMFARRFSSVAGLLEDGIVKHKNAAANDDADSEKIAVTLRLLRLGLYRRACQILHNDDPPRALRIRALVDFVWSQALVLGQPPQAAARLPALEDLVTTLQQEQRYDEFAPGFRHATIEGATVSGPVHVNVLRIRPTAADSGPVTRMLAVDARQEGDKLRSGGVDKDCGCSLTALATQERAAAAVSGGFFLYSEPDIAPPSRRTDPVGLLVTRGGVVAGPPVFRRATLIQTVDGKFDIQTVGMDGVTVRISNDNSCSETAIYSGIVGVCGVRCAHRGHGKTVSLGDDEVGVSIVGRKVWEVSSASKVKDTAMDVPLAGFVLIIPINAATAKTDALQAGNDVTYTLPIPNVQASMAGGPVLYCADDDESSGGDLKAMDLPGEDFCGSAPPVTFSQDETFDRNLLPRMAAGLTADGELVLAAVDGRNLERALGLTLQGTANLLKSLGCVRAMNLDGGSSKRMYVRGKGVVCLSTTEIKAAAAAAGPTENGAAAAAEKQRPVHSAILFLPPLSSST